jgi:tRNA-2-methylthio-N6-dimethylallyladenosine synthase
VEVLVEQESKKDKNYWSGRNTQNLTVVFPKTKNEKLGDLVNIKIVNCTSGTLIGQAIIK